MSGVDSLLICGGLWNSMKDWDILLAALYVGLALCFLVLDLYLVAEIFWRCFYLIV